MFLIFHMSHPSFFSSINGLSCVDATPHPKG